MDDALIRAVRPDDASDIACLETRPLVQRGTLRLPFQRESFFQNRLDNLPPTTTWLIAEVEGAVVGEAGLMVRNGRQAHRGDLFCAVHDEYWGKGIGRRLCAAVLDVADNWLGLRRVQLEVFWDNERAVALYRSLGFREEGVLRADAMREGVLTDTLVMGRVREAAPHRERPAEAP